MIRIKICGITRREDAVAAALAGADAIGLVFAESPRQVTIERAREILAALPPWLCSVGVFVNEETDIVRKTAESLGLGEVQLHGDEPPKVITELAPLRVVKAVRVIRETFADEVRRFSEAGAAAVLLEAPSPSVRGGSGKRFDWDLVAGARDAGALDRAPPLILAGGLTDQNVAAAIHLVRPWGVDVSTGVEEQPGLKSAEKMARFVAAVRGSLEPAP